MSKLMVDNYGDLDISIPYYYDDNDYITVSKDNIIKAYEEAGYKVTIEKEINNELEESKRT